MEGDRMRILIADDYNAIRAGVIRILQSRGDEYAEATSGTETVEKALEWKPDLVLLDIRLPVLSGFDAARILKQHHPDTPILFCSIYDSPETLQEARLIGDGFILKEKMVEMLPSAIEAVVHNKQFFPADSQPEPGT
jgi:DNA-binding NarL/FixJ family response regulator